MIDGKSTGIVWWSLGELGPQPAKLAITGKDNDGKPRQDFADRLAVMPDEEFVRVAEQKIWLSAYASNNPRSDYHWMADACHDESLRRGAPCLYDSAWHRASGM